MERTEALREIVKVVDGIPYDDFNIHTANAILRKLEELGMLPPLDKKAFYNASEAMQDIQKHYTTRYHKWEDNSESH